MAKKQYVYFYGISKELTEGDKTMKAVLGGKGANLAEMSNAGWTPCTSWFNSIY